MNNIYFILMGITTAKNLFFEIILQGGGITKGRMTKSNVYYNLTIKYCINFSLVLIYNIILFIKIIGYFNRI